MRLIIFLNGKLIFLNLITLRWNWYEHPNVISYEQLIKFYLIEFKIKSFKYISKRIILIKINKTKLRINWKLKIIISLRARLKFYFN